MHLLLITCVDLLLTCIATVGSFLVRDDFQWSGAEPKKLLYLGTTLAVALVINAVFRLNHGLWRYINFSNAVRVVVAVASTVLITVLIMFWIFRLEGVSRTLPMIQFLAVVSALLGGRVLSRLWHAHRSRSELIDEAPAAGGGWTTLVVGVTPLAQLYLRAVKDFGATNVSVAGLIGYSRGELGRAIDGHRVIGVIDELPAVLRKLEVHGVFVDKIVVADRFDRLRPEDVEMLDEIETSSEIEIEHFAERFDFSRPSPRLVTHPGMAQDQASRTAYARIKRIGDVCLAGTMLIALSPVIAGVALIVALALGRPVLFWQRRPGLRSRNFRLHKFRTLGPSHDRFGRKIDDDARMGFVGKLLRHTRLDELPQLFNILVGDMSFVGPRPLLPVDQPARFMSRLDVRPGLTGWAQVNGGRLVSAEDKGAMDAWYVRNMSFALDVRIVLLTVPMLLRRERLNNDAVSLAWRTLPETR